MEEAQARRQSYTVGVSCVGATGPPFGRFERIFHPRGALRLKPALKAAMRLVNSHRSHPWPGFGEPFNGQSRRAETIDALVAGFRPGCCIETGTFFGHTSQRMADYGVPVYTIEHDPGLARIARLRLWRRKNVRVLRGDSAVVLRELADNGALGRPFLYLDAHWGSELPLASEVQTALSAWADCVIAIDDFLVPHDQEYGYDTYDGIDLRLELLSLPPEATAAFPAGPATAETGARRGTVYLARGDGAKVIQDQVLAGRLRPAG